MADPNAFPDKEKEELDAKIDKKINDVLSNIDWNKIDTTVDERLKQVDGENRIKEIKQTKANYEIEIERKEKSKTLPMLKPINIINKEILDLMDTKFEKETELQKLQEQQHLND